jgi:hypothetical protein
MRHAAMVFCCRRSSPIAAHVVALVCPSPLRDLRFESRELLVTGLWQTAVLKGGAGSAYTMLKSAMV